MLSLHWYKDQIISHAFVSEAELVHDSYGRVMLKLFSRCSSMFYILVSLCLIYFTVTYTGSMYVVAYARIALLYGVYMGLVML